VGAQEKTMSRQRVRPAGSSGTKKPPKARAPSNGKHGAAAAPISAKTNGGWFHWFASKTSHLSGRPWAFALAVALIVVWAVTGPLFGFSDTWQLVINTGTTIITFLMVFLIQHTQNRDTLALQVKLAELIIAAHGAKNQIATAEDLSDEELEALHNAYCKRATETLDSLKARRDPSQAAE
jgi:low affinity Fe/Cu permease